MLVFTEASQQRRRGTRLAEHGTERLDLERIAELGAGAVGFDVTDAARRDPGAR